MGSNPLALSRGRRLVGWGDGPCLGLGVGLCHCQAHARCRQELEQPWREDPSPNLPPLAAHRVMTGALLEAPSFRAAPKRGGLRAEGVPSQPAEGQRETTRSEKDVSGVGSEKATLHCSAALSLTEWRKPTAVFYCLVML